MPVRSQAAEQPSPLRPQSASWCRQLGRKRRQLLSPPRAHSPLADASRVLPELWCTCGFSPAPSPRTDELSPSPCSRTPPATGLLPWVLKEPPGCVGGGGAWIAVPAASRGEGEGKRREERRDAQSWWRHRGGTGVLALLPLPRRDLDPQALCYRGSDKCFKARRRRGRGEKLGGEGAPFLCTAASVTAPASGAAGLRAEAPCHVPVPPLVLASLAGRLPRQKSRGRRRRKDGGARPAPALPAESGGRQRQDTQGRGGEVEEGLSERGGMGSFPSPQSAPGRVSS